MKISPHNQNSLINDVVWGKSHGIFEDKVGRRLYRAWEIVPDDEVVAALIRQRVRPLQRKEILGTLPPFKKPNLRTGDIVLGYGWDQEPLRTSVQSFNTGLLLAGGTGSGKTNLLSFWQPQIAATGCQEWLTEMYKRHLRDLRPMFSRLGIELVVLSPQNWKFNPLQAGLCHPHEFLNVIVDVLVRILDLLGRARTILYQGCHQLYAKFGIWEGQKDAWPTLFDLYEWVRERPDLNAAAREAILDRLGSLCVSLSPRCAAYRKAWQANELAKFSIVFEMGGAAETVKQVVLEPLLYSLLRYEVERGRFNSAMDLFVAFEDSQRFFDGGGEANGLTPMEELAGVIRGSAKGLGVIVQTLRGLSPRLIANLSNKIMGRLGTAQDYHQLGADMGMNTEQIEWAKRNLKPGTYIGQLADNEWREPFIFNVPLLNIPPVVSDEEVRRSVEALDFLPVVPAEEFANWKPRHLIEVSDSHVPSSHNPLLEAELRFLAAVVENPGQSSSSYAKILGINGGRAAEIRVRLVELNFIREHSVATNPRGRSSMILEPLDEGIDYLNHHPTDQL